MEAGQTGDSINDARPAKRQRDDDSGSSVPQSTEFWLEDGTVVIKSRNVQFRVHRGTLSMHSEFFKNMFDIPQPEDVETVSGCPVVDVTDTSEDWVALLKMLYQPLEMMEKVDTLPYSFFASIIRLGKKYEFRAIAQAGLHQLKKTFQHPRACMMKGTLRSIRPVIVVVEELNIDVLRPALYYWCLRNLTPLQIANEGLSTQNDMPIQLPRSFRDTLIVYRDTVRLSLISHVWLPLYQTRVLPLCYARTCDTPLQQHITAILATPVKHSHLESRVVAGICTSCQAYVSSKVAAGLDDFFKQLPLCFKMKEYAQLQDYAD